jgi:hypothetical protein
VSILLPILPTEELESLRRLALGVMVAPIISVEHVEKLVGCGFAAVRAGALVVTTLGRGKLAVELTRATWIVAPARAALAEI